MVIDVIAGIASFLEGYGVGVVVADVIATVLVVGGLYELSNALAPSQKSGGAASLQANYYSTEAGLVIIYGQVRVGGMETIPPTLSGPKGEYLHKVLTLAGHECAGASQVYANDVVIDNTIITNITGADTDGLVTAGKYNTWMWLRRYLGASTDSYDYKLNNAWPTTFSSTGFLGRGICKLYITMWWGAAIYGPTGVPTFTVLLDGAYIYDPRLDSTNGGSGSMRYTDQSTWKTYTTAAIRSNPALCLANYLIMYYGGSYDPASEIDWATVIAAANVCDALVANAAAGTEPRYTTNGRLIATDPFISNLQILVDAMLGHIIYTDGKWRMYAGSWTTPATGNTINESDWVSNLTLQFDGGRDSRYNRVRAWFIDKTNNWQRLECYPRANATYQAADGNEWIDRQTDQIMCTGENECQRKAEFMLRQSRNQVMVSGKLGPKWQNNVQLWSTFTVNHALFGWTSKTFRVVACTVNPDSSVDVSLREEQSTDWTDLLAADYGTNSTAALPTINQTTPTQPGALTAAELTNGTLAFSWSRSTVEPLGTVYQIWRAPAAFPNSPQGILWEGNATAAYVPSSSTDIGKISYYWVGARADSYQSDWNPSSGSQGVPLLLLQRSDNTLNNGPIPDPNFTVGTPTYWNLNATGTSVVNYFDDGSIEVAPFRAGNASYVASGGPVAGFVRLVGSSNATNAPGVSIAPFNYPNMVNSAGFPTDFTRGAYRFDVKYRVNSSTAGLSIRTSAQRATSPSNTIYGNPVTDAVALNATPGAAWRDVSVYSFLPPILSVNSPDNMAYLQPALMIVGAGAIQQFNVDIGQCYVTRLTPANYPWYDAQQISGIAHNTDQSRRVILVGSDTYAVSSYSLPGWAIGEYITLAKVNSSGASRFSCPLNMTLQNTMALTNTVVMAGPATCLAKITRVASAQFNVEGYGLS